MSSLIAYQVKTNMCSISVKFFIVHTIFVPLYTLNGHNNDCNKNLHSSHLIDTTLIITITCLSDTIIRCSAHNLFVSTALIR